MAAKAGCVHLILSKDRKLGRKGGARPHSQQHHPRSCASRTPFLNQVLAGHRKSTGSPQAIPQKPHSFHKAKMHAIPSRLFHHTAHTRAHLISCMGGATPPPHNYTHFLPRPPRHLAGVRGHMYTGRGTRPPVVTSRLWAPQGPQMPRPTGTNKTCIKACTHTARMTWDTPTS